MAENPIELNSELQKLKNGTRLVQNMIQENSNFLDYLRIGTDLQFEGQNQVLFSEVFDPKSSLNQKIKLKSNLSQINLRSLIDLRKVDFDKITGGDLRIYWPYHEIIDSIKNNTITITFNPLISEDENMGYRLIKINEEWILKDTVLVNDDFAFLNPVLIIDFPDLLDSTDLNSRKYSKIENSNLSIIPNCCSTITLSGINHVNKVYVNLIRISNNFRGLFGGDNKITFHFSDENVSTSNPNSKNSAPIYISRYQGRKSHWVAKATLFDQNWSNEQISKFIVVETDDSSKSTELKLTGTVKIAAKVKVDKNGVALELGPEASIGAELTIKRDSEFRKFEYNRRQFFFENWQNAESRGIHPSDKNAIRSQEFRRGTLFYTFGVVAYNYSN